MENEIFGVNPLDIRNFLYTSGNMYISKHQIYNGEQSAWVFATLCVVRINKCIACRG